MPERPETADEFLKNHPLFKAFEDVYERMQHPPTSYFQEWENEGQWNLVAKAINKDYVRYLRRWAKERL